MAAALLDRFKLLRAGGTDEGHVRAADGQPPIQILMGVVDPIPDLGVTWWTSSALHGVRPGRHSADHPEACVFSLARMSHGEGLGNALMAGPWVSGPPKGPVVCHIDADRSWVLVNGPWRRLGGPTIFILYTDRDSTRDVQLGMLTACRGAGALAVVRTSDGRLLDLDTNEPTTVATLLAHLERREYPVVQDPVVLFASPLPRDNEAAIPIATMMAFQDPERMRAAVGARFQPDLDALEADLRAEMTGEPDHLVNLSVNAALATARAAQRGANKLLLAAVERGTPATIGVTSTAALSEDRSRRVAAAVKDVFGDESTPESREQLLVDAGAFFVPVRPVTGEDPIHQLLMNPADLLCCIPEMPVIDGSDMDLFPPSVLSGWPSRGGGVHRYTAIPVMPSLEGSGEAADHTRLARLCLSKDHLPKAVDAKSVAARTAMAALYLSMSLCVPSRRADLAWMAYGACVAGGKPASFTYQLCSRLCPVFELPPGFAPSADDIVLTCWWLRALGDEVKLRALMFILAGPVNAIRRAKRADSPEVAEAAAAVAAMAEMVGADVQFKDPRLLGGNSRSRKRRLATLTGQLDMPDQKYLPSMWEQVCRMFPDLSGVQMPPTVEDALLVVSYKHREAAQVLLQQSHPREGVPTTDPATWMSVEECARVTEILAVPRGDADLGAIRGQADALLRDARERQYAERRAELERLPPHVRAWIGDDDARRKAVIAAHDFLEPWWGEADVAATVAAMATGTLYGDPETLASVMVADRHPQLTPAIRVWVGGGRVGAAPPDVQAASVAIVREAAGEVLHAVGFPPNYSRQRVIFTSALLRALEFPHGASHSSILTAAAEAALRMLAR